MTDDRDNSNADDQAPPPLSRRDFATLAGSLAFTTWLAACVPGGKDVGGVAPRAAARLLSSHTETLPDGVTRKTLVIAIDSLPPNGVGTVSTTLETTQPTATGDIREFDITFSPALVMAMPGRSIATMRMRYEYTHGEVQGDSRLDTVVMTSVIDGKQTVRTKKTLRPLNPVTAVTGMSDAQQLEYGLDLLNKYGHIPHNLPGMSKSVAS
jgi:hypothetical protein